MASLQLTNAYLNDIRSTLMDTDDWGIPLMPYDLMEKDAVWDNNSITIKYGPESLIGKLGVFYREHGDRTAELLMQALRCTDEERAKSPLLQKAYEALMEDRSWVMGGGKANQATIDQLT